MLLMGIGEKCCFNCDLPRLACALTTCFLLAASACVVVPVRVPTHERDVSGKPLDLDFSFLKSGSTTRDEVTKNLAAIDAEVKESNFFWGRWDSSKWRSTAVGFVPPGGDRIWRADNLLIAFDPNGIVKTWVVVDDKGLSQQLDLLIPASDEPPLELSPAVEAKMMVPHNDYTQASLVLSEDSFEERRTSSTNQSTSLRTPRSNVLRVVPTPEASYYGPISAYTPYTRSGILLVTVYLEKNAMVRTGGREHSVGKKLWMGVDPSTFLLLRRYIQQKNVNLTGTQSVKSAAPHSKP